MDAFRREITIGESYQRRSSGTCLGVALSKLDGGNDRDFALRKRCLPKEMEGN